MTSLPSEIAIGGVYFSPLLIASIVGVVLTWVLTRLLNRFHLSRFFWWPPLVFLAMCVLCVLLIRHVLLPF